MFDQPTFTSLRQLLVNDSEQYAVAIAIGSGIASKADIQNALNVDIDNFISRTRNVLSFFKRVYEDMIKLDQLVDEGTYVSRWHGFRERFLDSLEKTKGIAARVSELTAAFDNRILPEAVEASKPGASDAQKQKVINMLSDQMKENEDIVSLSKAISDEFRNLQNSLQNFGKDLDRERASSRDQAIYYMDQAREFRFSAEHIKIEIKEWKATKGYVPRELLLRLEEMETAIRSASDKADNWNMAVWQLDELIELFTGRMLNILGLVGDLEFFEQIWSSANSDMVKIQTYMRDLIKYAGAKRPIPTLISVYLKNTSTHYGQLAEALKSYADAITTILGDDSLWPPLR